MGTKDTFQSLSRDFWFFKAYFLGELHMLVLGLSDLREQTKCKMSFQSNDVYQLCLYFYWG